MHYQYGAHYFKPHQPTSKCVKLQGTRMIGCTASVQIRKFAFYPEYSVDLQLSKTLSKKQVRTVKEAALKQLESKLCYAQEASTVQTTDKYFVSLPTEEAHHQESIEMKCHLKHYVLKCLSKDESPDPNDHAYFLTVGDIRNHMNQAQKTLKLSLIDQENVALKIAEYQKLSPETKIHFQLFTKSDEGESDSQEL